MKLEHFVEHPCKCSKPNSKWNETPQSRADARFPGEHSPGTSLIHRAGTFHPPLRGGTPEQGEQFDRWRQMARALAGKSMPPLPASPGRRWHLLRDSDSDEFAARWDAQQPGRYVDTTEASNAPQRAQERPCRG